jgi:hypothetical protein
MSKLVDAGFPRIGEANFRMLKRRLLAKVKIIRSKDELPEEGEWFGILLDRNKF